MANHGRPRLRGLGAAAASGWLGAVSLLVWVAVSGPPAAQAGVIDVADEAELRAAFAAAAAGDTIALAAGTYPLSGALWTAADGAPGAPIAVTAAALGDVRIEVDGVEGVVIANAYWTLENLWIDCVGSCDAGVHVKPEGDSFTLRSSRVTNFIQHVKASRTPDDAADSGTIADSEFYDDTLLGSTPLDLVGGRAWLIVGNYVHDYGGDPNGDYGIFLKGATIAGVIERNIVVCANDLAPGGATLGISFGGGGTGFQFCPNSDCSCEDFDSIARNNLVLHCTDAGLHTKRACGSRFLHNTVFDVGIGLQIQEDGAGAPVIIQNNVMSHRVVGGANRTETGNLTDVPNAAFAAIYADPAGADFRDGSDPSAARDRGGALAEVTDDYCRTIRRDGNHDLGAIEFPAACSTWPWRGAAPPGRGDAGPGGEAPDAGSSAGEDGSLEGGCGCAVDGSARAGSVELFAGALALLGIGRRRRRQS